MRNILEIIKKMPEGNENLVGQRVTEEQVEEINKAYK